MLIYNKVRFIVHYVMKRVFHPVLHFQQMHDCDPIKKKKLKKKHILMNKFCA